APGKPGLERAGVKVGGADTPGTDTDSSETSGVVTVGVVSGGVVGVEAGVCVCPVWVVTIPCDSKGSETDTPSSGTDTLEAPERTPPRTAGASRPSRRSSVGVKRRVATVVTSRSGWTIGAFGAATADR